MAAKIVKGLKQRLGHFTEMLKFLDDLRAQELVQAEPEGVWDDLEVDTAMQDEEIKTAAVPAAPPVPI